MTSRKDIVAEGTWLYDGVLEKPVYIVRLDHDFWFEIGKADDQLEPGEQPRLDDEGFAYYASFHGIRPDGTFWPRLIGYRSLAEAKAEVERLLPSAVEWE